MKYTWDDIKNQTNHRKDGIWFEEAQTVWVDGFAIEFFDPEHSDGEDRFIRIGHSKRMNVFLVVFCERDHGNTIRIIWARKATKKEKEDYEKGI